jgi:hypothetical protein
MQSPFRDDEGAAAHTIEELWSNYERLGRRVHESEAEIARARALRWVRTFRVVLLGLTFGAAYLVGYYSDGENTGASCGLEEGWLR